MKTIISTAAALLLTTAGSAYAGSVTYSSTVAGEGNGIAATTANWSTDGSIGSSVGPLDILQFNNDGSMAGIPAGAILTGVSLEFFGASSFDYAIENTSTSAATTGNVDLSVTLDFSGTGFIDQVINAANTGAINLSIADGSIDFGGTSGATFALNDTGSTGLFSLLASGFGAYTGTGSVAFLATAVSDKTLNLSGGNIVEQTTWTAGADVAVTYTFSDATVAEPTSVALIGLGLSLIGLQSTARRRKQSK